MKTEEAAVMLAKVSAYDRRTVGRADAEAWADAMTRGSIAAPDALEAVAQHFQDTNDWLMPNHIIVRVKAMKRARVANALPPQIPANLEPAAERGWLLAYWDAVKAAAADAQAAADGTFGIVRPAEQLTPRPDRLKVITALANAKGVA